MNRGPVSDGRIVICARYTDDCAERIRLICEWQEYEPYDKKNKSTVSQAGIGWP